MADHYNEDTQGNQNQDGESRRDGFRRTRLRHSEHVLRGEKERERERGREGEMEGGREGGREVRGRRGGGGRGKGEGGGGRGGRRAYEIGQETIAGLLKPQSVA